jgi:prepilin-type N-terminal cleavage/methylation domain-containing protein
MIRAHRGFSLVEVTIAMTVLATGVLAVTPLVSRSMQAGMQARRLAVAQQLGQDFLERLRAEVRYDSSGASSPALAPADAWKFDVPPHVPGAALAGAGCQPAGQDDGTTYDYGPFPFVREDLQLLVCYRLAELDPTAPAFAALPIGSMHLTVRVLWRAPSGGWSAWAVTDLMVSGA